MPIYIKAKITTPRIIIYICINKFYNVMKNIIGLLFLLVSFFSLISCNKDNDEEIIEEKQYEFSSIMWALQEGDGEDLFEIKTPEQVFRNTGNTTKEIVINSSEKVEESSQFFIDENILPYLPEEEITIAFPDVFELLSSEYKYFVGGRKAPFKNEKTLLPPNRTTTETISLAPSCELRNSSTFTMKKIKATYRIRFVEKEGIDSYEKEGKWEGVFIVFENSQTVINEIK